MQHGDVYKLNDYKNWNYFRVLGFNEIEEDRDDNDEISGLGKSLYITGNVLTKENEIIKNEKLYLKDFMNMFKKDEIKEGDEADIAIIFLSYKDF